ncbi:histidine kinase [Streptomyces sp. H27-C3]|uniref:sensor histidine kinase n=1 Tax=Streptomyces sp. H27-C3 TaxID=3046305 RepID=UPI0024B886BC|nr:histidine kinase [Streptomyces sp. H27-C3]MDJ0466246.1 histidine kinase [Streptomyces sp. H27-C3]
MSSPSVSQPPPSQDTDAAAAVRQAHLVTEALTAYAEALAAVSSPLVAHPGIWARCRMQAEHILNECIGALLTGDFPESGADAEFTSLAVVSDRAIGQVSPLESVRAAQILTDVALDVLSAEAARLPAESSLGCLSRAARMLSRSVMTRLSAGRIGYEAATLRSVGDANAAHRIRLGRDLHDHIGTSLSLAIRYLELHEVEKELSTPPDPARDRIAEALAVLSDAVRFTRTIVGDLRHEPLNRSLSEAIDTYAQTLATPTTVVDFQVKGDESWIPESHRQELFLIIRECLHNALAHSGASRIVAELLISPTASTCTVTDNGVGIAPHLPAGNGITAMRERVASLSGHFRLSSVPGQGTQAHIHIPLSKTRSAE